MKSVNENAGFCLKDQKGHFCPGNKYWSVHDSGVAFIDVSLSVSVNWICHEEHLYPTS